MGCGARGEWGEVNHSSPAAYIVIPGLSQFCVLILMTDYCVLSELFELIKRLFLPLKGSKDVSPSTISRWICNVIKLAYADLSSSDLSFMKISAHEVRALSSSWAYWNSVPLDDVVPIALLPHFISEIWPQLDKIHHPWVLL